MIKFEKVDLSCFSKLCTAVHHIKAKFLYYLPNYSKMFLQNIQVAFTFVSVFIIYC